MNPRHRHNRIANNNNSNNNVRVKWQIFEWRLQENDMLMDFLPRERIYCRSKASERVSWIRLDSLWLLFELTDTIFRTITGPPQRSCVRYRSQCQRDPRGIDARSVDGDPCQHYNFRHHRDAGGRLLQEVVVSPGLRSFPMRGNRSVECSDPFTEPCSLLSLDLEGLAVDLDVKLHGLWLMWSIKRRKKIKKLLFLSMIKPTQIVLSIAKAAADSKLSTNAIKADENKSNYLRRQKRVSRRNRRLTMCRPAGIYCSLFLHHFVFLPFYLISVGEWGERKKQQTKNELIH